MNEENKPRRDEFGPAVGQGSTPDPGSNVPPTPPGDGRGGRSEDEGDTNVAKVARGAGISTAGQGVGRVLAFVTQVVLARLLGKELYGFFTLGVAVVNGVHIISRFGMENCSP